MDIKNLSIIRQIFANTVFTHKVQEFACERNLKKANDIKKGTLLGVFLTLMSIVLSLSIPNLIFFNYLGIFLSVFDIVFLVFQLLYNFDFEAGRNKASALKYMELRNEYQELIADIMNESLNTKEIITRRDQLSNKYHIICDLSPQTNLDDYICAQKALGTNNQEGGEQYTWNDKEIDKFLPEELRLKSN